MSKQTGDRYERRFVRWFDKAGYGVMRAPSSGSSTNRDLPDVFAVDHDEKLAVEVKYQGDPSAPIYVKSGEASSLRRFADRTDSTPIIAARFARTKTFYLFRLEQARETDDGNLAFSKSIGHNAAAKLADEDDREGWNDVRTDPEDNRLTPTEAETVESVVIP